VTKWEAINLFLILVVKEKPKIVHATFSSLLGEGDIALDRRAGRVDKARKGFGCSVRGRKTMSNPSPVLFFFKATPDHIEPFQSSTLSWNAALPDGFTLTLNNAWVPQTGDAAVQPVVTTDYTIRALHGGSETALGYVTVSVANTCVQQPKKYVQNLLQLFLVAAFNFGSGITSAQAQYPPAVSITPGLITFDLKGSAIVVVTANVEIKGSFGLTVDHNADDLAPVNETSHVSCSVSAGTWAAAIGAGAVSGAAAGWAIGGAIGGVFGGVIGAIAGAIAGGIAGGVTLNWVINKARHQIETYMPLLFQTLAQNMSSWFSEPPGMAMADVAITPDGASGDGDVTVTYCPKL
jgi:hypothetical protein